MEANLSIRSLAVTMTLAAAALLAPAGSAQAALTVANTNDSGPGSLRQAVSDAAPGETIEVPAGTYTLTSAQLTVNKALTIAGAGQASTVLRSTGGHRILSVGSKSPLVLRDLSISDTTIAGTIVQGGLIGAGETSLTFERVAISNNHINADGGAGQGGGIIQAGLISASSAELTMIESRISGNRISAMGAGGKAGGIVQGGLVLSGRATTLWGTSIEGNTVDARGGQDPAKEGQSGGIIQGGGLLLAQTGALATTIDASTFAGNVIDASAGAGGGGGTIQGGIVLASNDKGVDSFRNLTIASNVARSRGVKDGTIQGGVAILGSSGEGTNSILSSTIAGNAVESSATGSTSLITTGKSTFGNTIVADGSAQTFANCSANPEVTSLGFNIDSLDQCGFKAAGDLVNTDPRLGPLASNGGPTLTRAPLLDSPVVDQGAGFGLAVDQRVLTRPIDLPSVPNSAVPGADGSDIGAVELQLPPPPPPPTLLSNGFRLGKVTKNRKKGKARIQVILPQPSAGALTLTGAGVKRQVRAITGQATVSLPIVGKKKARRTLVKRGKRKVKFEVTYTPTGTPAATKSRTVKLVKKKKKVPTR
jgi:hypothetical protein